jgi:hypothetical protein
VVLLLPPYPSAPHPGPSRLRSRDAPNITVRKWQDGQVSRFNEREGENKDRFAKTLGNVAGRRLAYDVLTGKAISN